MKKLSYLIIFAVFLFIVITFVLATSGVKTNKFNYLIEKKVSETKSIDLKLNVIKFKFDIKGLSLFLETNDPRIIYDNISIPTQSIKVYVDFLSLLKSEPKIKKIDLNLKELNLEDLNNLSSIIKPSNFKSFLNNKIKNGKLISKIEIFLDSKGSLKNFIAKGKVKNLNIELISGLNLTKTSLSFFADKDDILIKNIFGNLEDILISNGDIKLNLENGIKLNSNFNSKINLKKKDLNNYELILDKLSFIENIESLSADISNNIYINLDNTYKVKDYNYSISGKLKKSEIKLSKPITNNIIVDKIGRIYLSDFQIKSEFSPNKTSTSGTGKYSFDENNFQKIKFENFFQKDLFELSLDIDYKNSFKLDLINYSKLENDIANISLTLQKQKDKTQIKKFNYEEGSNFLKIDDLIFKKNNLSSFKKIEVKTPNNNFLIQNKGKILIIGDKFDATNLAKFLNNQTGESKLQKINSLIEIDFKEIKVPVSEKLQNFKLLGEIQKGQFVKITSKGDFGGNNFLDITMKKDKNSNRKYLEIYSDLTRPLLTEYSFFNGLSGGKLLFSSIIDGPKSNSKLKIENFKVVNAPGVIKLLSLADLGGLADLAEGEGLSFDKLEIDMQKNKNFLKLNEILALGPSISVLMEGYKDENGMTSLRGTLVPAKTLNKLISKIPLIGNIVIPKDVGEGLFGISFKMKGPKDKIKTTINPIRTLTPRFIQKIIERDKKLNKLN